MHIEPKITHCGKKSCVYILECHMEINETILTKCHKVSESLIKGKLKLKLKV